MSSARRLFLLGLIVRLAGLPFNGMADLYQILLDWGFGVHRHGLVSGFGINYGIFSYAFFGLAASAAEAMPRFWWAPYKIIILAFDAGVLAALLRLVPRDRWTAVMLMFWLNPWFVLHEAYYGFWEAPHILCALAAVLVLARSVRNWAWTAVGALLMCGAMFKPQGLLYFVGPVGLYLVVRGRREPTGDAVYWSAGAAAVFGVTSIAMWAAGGSILALVQNYRSAFTIMSGVSNGGPGFWRFVSFLYMQLTGQSGHVAFLHMPRLLIGALTGAAGGVCLTLLLLYARQLSTGPRTQAESLFLMMTMGALALSQFGARAHINHSYTMMVLLVPLAAMRGGLFRPWIVMSVLLGLSHLLVFGLGDPALLPPSDILSRFPSADSLIASVTALPAYRTPDALLAFQAGVNSAVHRLPAETLVSLLSPVVFVVACLMVRAMFDAARSKLALL